MHLSGSLIDWRYACLLLLAAILPAAGIEQAHAQTITNIAEARWEADGQERFATTNSVQTEASRPEYEVTFFAVAPDGDAAKLRTAWCLPQGSGVPDWQIFAASQQDSGFTGQTLLVSVSAPVANVSPGVVDRFQVALSTRAGDREAITVFETGENTGRFVGAFETRRARFENVQGDCLVSLGASDEISVSLLQSGSESPSGVVLGALTFETTAIAEVFDSQNGAPVSGARVTLVDAETGEPAQVFAPDGVSNWPSTVTSGQSITLASGESYALSGGEYWFPRVDNGRYRLIVEPPDPFIAPSEASPGQLELLTGPDGSPLTISEASFGEAFVVSGEALPTIDIPVDRPDTSLRVTKSVSRRLAQAGDALVFTVEVTNTDTQISRRGVTLEEVSVPQLRLRKNTVRIDGEDASDALTPSADGTGLSLRLGDLEPGTTRRVVYAMTVRVNATPGDIESISRATAASGAQAQASAALRVERSAVTDRMTIVGRISAGPCSQTGQRRSLGGIRVMMEDGSFAITDEDGRYHLDAVVPGTHVLQAIRSTLPDGAEFINCDGSVRSAGSAISRFVRGQGGELVKVDFHVLLPEGGTEEAQSETASGNDTPEQPQELVNPTAAWLALGDGPDDWIAPTLDANPRAPAIRIAIRHRQGHSVSLTSAGEDVDPLLFQGTLKSPDGGWAISHWQGVPLPDRQTRLTAVIKDESGVIVTELKRTVFFTNIAAQAKLVPETSQLIADGRTRPVIAVQILDPSGRPLREGLSGDVLLSAPYLSSDQLDQRQLDGATGRSASRARWQIEGDEGIALIELAPTLTSGSLRLDFEFNNEGVTRSQQVEAWIEPGDVEWTIIGLAEGTVGARSVADNMERAGDFDSDLGDNSRVALYAKGRILGRFLTTIAYDSAKQTQDQRILGTLDPNAYYTVFADRSARLFDAVSQEKLYLRVETANFRAVYGDFRTGFDQTQLTRYNRAMTGVRAAARIGEFEVQGFAADVTTRLRRDEIQGDGTSGPYALSDPAIIPNSETIFLEVRDRLRGEVIVESRQLEPFVDYTIDRLSGQVTFSRPVLSRDAQLNPRFIVVEYEVETLGNGKLNAGARATWQNEDRTLRVGASVISDSSIGTQGEEARTNLAGFDVEAEIAPGARVRAEYAISERGGERSKGWSVEADYQSQAVNARAYASALDQDFGVGQQNGVELGVHRIGADARIAIDQSAFVTVSAWQADSLNDDRRRRAGEISAEYITPEHTLSVGFARIEDRGSDGKVTSSTVLNASATQRLLGNRLEIGGSTSIALGTAGSVDLPSRHRVTARYAVSDAVRLTGSYEIADGAELDARTLQGGVEVNAWPGAQITADLGQQSQTGLGGLGNNGTFAGLGLNQSLQLTDSLAVNATLESNWALTTSDPESLVVIPGQPFSSGGQLAANGGLLEDFTALTLGANWQREQWTLNARAEYRDSDLATRKGVLLGAVRQLGSGNMLGASLNWTNASAQGGAETEVLDAALAFAHRPESDNLAVLGKLEYRADRVTDARLGQVGPLGRTALNIEGNALSRRFIGSISADFSNLVNFGAASSLVSNRNQLRLFGALRHNLDRVEGLDLSTTSMVGGLIASLGLTDRVEVGLSGNLQAALSGGEAVYSFGPLIGFSPANDVVINLGYNFAGYSDPDFITVLNTQEGWYLSVRAKFDGTPF